MVYTDATGALTEVESNAMPSQDADIALVGLLDLKFQEAVKYNDAKVMNEILDERFVMVLGDGRTFSKMELLEEARAGAIEYEIQDEIPGTQTVRVWGDTAVVTALLHIRGRDHGKPFERCVWFSDTYVRTGEGWRYAFAQVSLPIPQPTQSKP